MKTEVQSGKRVQGALRVAMITCWYRHVSMANYALNLRNGLERLGVRIRIVSAPCACREKLCQTPEMNDVNYRFTFFPPFFNINTKIRGLSGILFVVDSILQFLRGISYFSKSKDCDILHYQQSAYSFGLMPLVSLLLIPSTKKRIVTLHSASTLQLRFRFINEIYRNADCVIVHSESMRRLAAALMIPERKTRKVFLGTTIPPLKKVVRKEITFFGAPNEGKGISTVLQALKILNESNQGAILHIYGIYSFNEREYTVRKAQELGVEDNLIWGGQLGEWEFDTKMQESLVTLVVYSAPVSGSAVLTRAMANGTPIIASRIGGLPEYLGDAGILIQPNDPLTLADQIVRVSNNRELQEQLGSAARSRAIQLFDWQSVAAKTIDIYREVSGCVKDYS